MEETPKCQLGTIIKFAVKGFLCILIQLYRFGWIFTLNWNKMLHFPLNITNFSVSDTMFITFFYIFQISIHSVMKIHEYQYQESNTQGTKWALAHSHLRVGEAPGEYPSVCTGPYYRVPKKKKKKKKKKSN